MSGTRLNMPSLTLRQGICGSSGDGLTPETGFSVRPNSTLNICGILRLNLILGNREVTENMVYWFSSSGGLFRPADYRSLLSWNSNALFQARLHSSQLVF